MHMIGLRRIAPLLALAAGLLAPAATRAHDDPSGNAQVIVVDDKTDAAWLAKARAEYPMDTCVVSGDSLEEHSMGKRLDIIYREPGKPDRLVRFCCKGCLTDFRKDPARFLRVLDEAAARRPHP
jgi:hypothetical protein